MHQHFVKSFNRCYKPGISNLVRMAPRQLRRTRKLLHSLATVDYEISTNRILSVVYPYTVIVATEQLDNGKGSVSLQDLHVASHSKTIKHVLTDSICVAI